MILYDEIRALSDIYETKLKISGRATCIRYGRRHYSHHILYQVLEYL
jgi:hypothetical protein